MFKFSKTRLEAFSDGVIAIIITIMVLDIPLPSAFGLPEIIELLRSILVFFASFIIVGNYWHNHHFMMEMVSEVTSKLLWRNLLFLFFLSLVPIFSKWVILHSDEVVPAIGYDIVFLLVNVSFYTIWSGVERRDKRERTPEEIERLSGRSIWLRWVIMVVAIGAIIILSIFYPRISLIFFIGFPVVFSLFNLVFDRTQKRRTVV